MNSSLSLEQLIPLRKSLFAVLLLLAFGRPASAADLAERTGYHRITIRHHLRRLREAGLIVPKGRRGCYVPQEQVFLLFEPQMINFFALHPIVVVNILTQLKREVLTTIIDQANEIVSPTAGDPSRNSQPVDNLWITSQGLRDRGKGKGPARNRGPFQDSGDPQNTQLEGEDLAPLAFSGAGGEDPDPQVVAALAQAGILLNQRTEGLARRPYVTRPYILGHWLRLKELGLEHHTGLLITTLESGIPAPELNRNEHLKTCRCDECHQLGFRKCFYCGQDPCACQARRKRN